MKILVKSNAELGTLAAIEVSVVYFDAVLNTLGFVSINDGGIYVVPGISKEETNKICEDIVKTGFYNLSNYGQYYPIDID